MLLSVVYAQSQRILMVSAGNATEVSLLTKDNIDPIYIIHIYSVH